LYRNIISKAPVGAFLVCLNPVQLLNKKNCCLKQRFCLVLCQSVKEQAMKKILVLLSAPLFLLSCDKDKEETSVICTADFRMIRLKVKGTNDNIITLDSAYTTRISNNQRFVSQQQGGPGYYVVMDDSYQQELAETEDNFRFTGWKNNQLVVNELYRIGADKCHIYKKSGADSVVVQ
jgi:hypothetical protein